MHDLDRSELKVRCCEILKNHKGPENCITMDQLNYKLTGQHFIPRRKNNQTRLLRSLIAEIREDGVPIAHNHCGYFYATDDEQLEKTANIFRKRALASFRQEQALRKTSTKELLEQYELELKQEEENHD